MKSLKPFGQEVWGCGPIGLFLNDARKADEKVLRPTNMENWKR